MLQSHLTLCDPMDYSPPDSSAHGIFQAKILEWVAISSSRGSSWPRDWTVSLALAGRFFTTESPRKPKGNLSSGYQVCRESWVALLSPFQRGLSLHTAAWEKCAVSPSLLLTPWGSSPVLCLCYCVGGKDCWFCLFLDLGKCSLEFRISIMNYKF